MAKRKLSAIEQKYPISALSRNNSKLWATPTLLTRTYMTGHKLSDADQIRYLLVGPITYEEAAISWLSSSSFRRDEFFSLSHPPFQFLYTNTSSMPSIFNSQSTVWCISWAHSRNTSWVVYETDPRGTPNTNPMAFVCSIENEIGFFSVAKSWLEKGGC